MFRSVRIAPSESREENPCPLNASEGYLNPSTKESVLIQAGYQLASTGYNHQQQVTRCIEWFRATFARVTRYHGKVTLRDFKQVAREREVGAGVSVHRSCGRGVQRSWGREAPRTVAAP